MNRLPGCCPICSGTTHVAEVACAACGTRVSGAFQLPPYSALAPEHEQFLELFLRTRGNISAVGDLLGVSFPTATRRLDSLLNALGFQPDAAPQASAPPLAASQPEAKRIDLEARERDRARIIEMLDRGEITAEEATHRLREM